VQLCEKLEAVQRRGEDESERRPPLLRGGERGAGFEDSRSRRKLGLAVAANAHGAAFGHGHEDRAAAAGGFLAALPRRRAHEEGRRETFPEGHEPQHRAGVAFDLGERCVAGLDVVAFDPDVRREPARRCDDALPHRFGEDCAAPAESLVEELHPRPLALQPRQDPREVLPRALRVRGTSLVELLGKGLQAEKLVLPDVGLPQRHGEDRLLLRCLSGGERLGFVGDPSPAPLGCRRREPLGDEARGLQGIAAEIDEASGREEVEVVGHEIGAVDPDRRILALGVELVAEPPGQFVSAFAPQEREDVLQVVEGLDRLAAARHPQTDELLRLLEIAGLGPAQESHRRPDAVEAPRGDLALSRRLAHRRTPGLEGCDGRPVLPRVVGEVP